MQNARRRKRIQRFCWPLTIQCVHRYRFVCPGTVRCIRLTCDFDCLQTCLPAVGPTEIDRSATGTDSDGITWPIREARSASTFSCPENVSRDHGQLEFWAKFSTLIDRFEESPWPRHPSPPRFFRYVTVVELSIMKTAVFPRRRNCSNWNAISTARNSNQLMCRLGLCHVPLHINPWNATPQPFVDASVNTITWWDKTWNGIPSSQWDWSVHTLALGLTDLWLEPTPLSLPFRTWAMTSHWKGPHVQSA